MKTMSAREAKNGFGLMIDTARAGPVLVEKHGRGVVVVLAVEAEALGEALVWEPSRGGDLFPHLYAQLPTAKVALVTEAPLGADGAPQLGALG